MQLNIKQLSRLCVGTSEVKIITPEKNVKRKQKITAKTIEASPESLNNNLSNTNLIKLQTRTTFNSIINALIFSISILLAPLRFFYLFN